MWGGVESVLVRSLGLSTASNWIGVQTGVHGLDSTQTCGFKNIASRGLVKQLWLPDEMSRTGVGKSTTFAAKGCVLSTQQEKSFKWTGPSEWSMMKRGKVDKQKETMVASYRYLRVFNPGLQMIGSNECDVPCLYDTRASFQYIRRIPTLNYSQA